MVVAAAYERVESREARSHPLTRRRCFMLFRLAKLERKIYGDEAERGARAYVTNEVQ